MKHLALIAATGSLAAFAVPAQAAEFAPAPSPIVAGYSPAALPFDTVAAYDRDDWRDRRDRRRWRDRNRDWDDRRWDDRRGERFWRGNDGRWRCRRDDGTVGLLVGAGVGALLGREVDRHGDRTLGTIVGAVGGGLLGREIDRRSARCR